MPSWTHFGHPAYRYRNEKGQWASDAEVRNWGHTSISENANAVKTLASGLTSGSLTVGQWEQQMRDAIKTEYIAQYLLGKGGRDNMTSEDWGSIGGMLADQYRYLDNFAIEIAAGNLSEAQIAARSAMYIRSSREAFERATARVRGIPDMPAFPGDGSTKCLVNCQCYWAYRKRGNTWECTWNLTAEENCEDCIDNAGKWNPLVLQIGEKAGRFVTIDERPVFIGGPGAGGGRTTSGEGNTLDKERDSVQGYVNMIANVQRNIAIARGFEYGGLEHIIEDVGQFDVGQPLPYGIERGELKECYRNAYNLMLDNSDLTYVEGIALSKGLIPISHAWCVDRHGLVVDNTWHNPKETVYFGVHLSRDFVISVVLDKGSYTVFDDMSSAWREIINNGMPPNALEGEETKAGHFVTIDERPVFIKPAKDN